jgi:hypothetical protein
MRKPNSALGAAYQWLWSSERTKRVVKMNLYGAITKLTRIKKVGNVTGNVADKKRPLISPNTALAFVFSQPKWPTGRC